MILRGQASGSGDCHMTPVRESPVSLRLPDLDVPARSAAAADLLAYS